MKSSLLWNNLVGGSIKLLHCKWYDTSIQWHERIFNFYNSINYSRHFVRKYQCFLGTNCCWYSHCTYQHQLRWGYFVKSLVFNRTLRKCAIAAMLSWILKFWHNVSTVAAAGSRIKTHAISILQQCWITIHKM